MSHRIYTYDGGHDGLLPGRWLANAQWLGPGHIAYGATEAAAVDALRETLRTRYPLVPWFAEVPVERGERDEDERKGK